ncbi:hypothetical protein LCGC14_1519280, partial [marine sediment metagenome]
MAKYPSIEELSHFSIDRLIELIFSILKGKSSKHANMLRDEAYNHLSKRVYHFTNRNTSHLVNVIPRKPNSIQLGLYNRVISERVSFKNKKRYQFIKMHWLDFRNKLRELDYWLENKNHCLHGRQWIRSLLIHRIQRPYLYISNKPHEKNDEYEKKLISIGNSLLTKKSKFIGLMLIIQKIPPEFLIPALKNVSVLYNHKAYMGKTLNDCWYIEPEIKIETLEKLKPHEILDLVQLISPDNKKLYNKEEIEAIIRLMFPIFDSCQDAIKEAISYLRKDIDK